MNAIVSGSESTWSSGGGKTIASRITIWLLSTFPRPLWRAKDTLSTLEPLVLHSTSGTPRLACGMWYRTLSARTISRLTTLTFGRRPSLQLQDSKSPTILQMAYCPGRFLVAHSSISTTSPAPSTVLPHCSNSRKVASTTFRIRSQISSSYSAASYRRQARRTLLTPSVRSHSAKPLRLAQPSLASATSTAKG